MNMNLQAYTDAKYDELLVVAQRQFNRTFRKLPVEFSNRMKSTGGYYQFNISGGVKIKLNNRMMLENGTKFVDEVLTHELAHHITHCEYGAGVQAHGREWKSVMRKLGAKPNRTHSYQRVGTKNTFTYEIAPGVKVELGVRRHNKIQRGISTYSYVNPTTRERISIRAEHYAAGKTSKPVIQTTKKTTTKKPVSKKTKVNGKPGSKSSIARKIIRGWIRMGYCVEGALQSNACIQEMIACAGLSGVAQSKSYIKTQWHKA